MRPSADQPGPEGWTRLDEMPQPVPLAAAAAHLGLSITAVKKRLQRGPLYGLTPAPAPRHWWQRRWRA